MASFSWPKLTVELPTVAWGQCQKCGTEGALHAELFVWQEHDRRDRSLPLAVVLCEPCSAIVEPHPRLYGRAEVHQTLPGVMALCEACEHRLGYLCQHPDLTTNGGPGLGITFPQPIRYHLRNSRGGGGFGWLFQGPPTECAGRSTE